MAANSADIEPSSTEAAVALLKAIAKSAPSASCNQLRDLAEAYSLVAGSAPKAPGSGKTIRTL